MPPSFKVLKSLPAYGPMYVPISESGEDFHHEGFVVEFFLGEGSWVANFHVGATDLFFTHQFDQESILVVAGGTAFMVNPAHQKAYAVFGGSYKQAYQYGNKKVVLINESRVDLIEKTGRTWQSEDISWDGIVDVKIDDDMLTGKSFDPQANGEDIWDEFSIDLSTKEITGGSYNKYEREKPKSLWWKFW